MKQEQDKENRDSAQLSVKLMHEEEKKVAEMRLLLSY